MSLIYLIVAIVIIGILVVGESYLPIDGRIVRLLQAATILIGALLLADRYLV